MRDKIDKLGGIILDHRKYQAAKNEVLGQIQAPSCGEIIMCIAPTGGGKTTMISDVIQHYRGLEETDSQPPNPPVSIEAPVALDRGYPWRTHYTQLLEALGEVGTDHRIYVRSNAKSGKESATAANLQVARIDDLRRATDSALYDRAPAAVFVDECQHLGTSPRGRVVSNNLDVVKQHRNAVAVPWVLMGTYQAQQMLAYTGQMARRVRLVYLEPYYPVSKERAEFRLIIERILQKIGLSVTFTLKSHEEELHGRSVGCVGVYCGWLARAIARAAQYKNKKVTWEDMEETAHYGWELATICEEIDAFREFAEQTATGITETGTQDPARGKRETTHRSRAYKPGTPAPYRWWTGGRN